MSCDDVRRYNLLVKFLSFPLLAGLLAFTGCASSSLIDASRLPPVRTMFVGTVLDITPRLVLAEMAWEHVVLVESPEGPVTVYAGDEDPGVRPGDRVQVRGERLEDNDVAGEVVLFGSIPSGR